MKKTKVSEVIMRYTSTLLSFSTFNRIERLDGVLIKFN